MSRRVRIFQHHRAVRKERFTKHASPGYHPYAHFCMWRNKLGIGRGVWVLPSASWSGHGLVDMAACQAYFEGRLKDHPLPEEEIKRALEDIAPLPKPRQYNAGGFD